MVFELVVIGYGSCPEHVPTLLPMKDLESHMVGEYHESETCHPMRKVVRTS